MSKKKRMQGLTEEERLFIEEKMSYEPTTVQYVDDYKRQLKLRGYKVDIKCKTERQKEFLNNLQDTNKIICFGLGAAGTGKSFISLSYALQQIKQDNYEHIIIVCPTAQSVGKDMSLGFIKGDLQQKTEMFKEADRFTIEKILKMSHNESYKQLASNLINSGVIQYEFINFMLGKTYDNSLILVNEAEQYTKEDLRLILTRIGENSKLILTGDCAQINRSSMVHGREQSGLSYCAERLSTLPETSVTTFDNQDIVRNPIITKILECID